MLIKNWKLFNESLARVDNKLEVIKRSKDLSEVEFIDILKRECSQFSFQSDLLWRNKKKTTDFQLFEPGFRNADPLAFPNFFNKIQSDKDYPVIRKKSLIGGTNLDTNKFLVGLDNHLVIPFNDSQIIFSPLCDLWAMADRRRDDSGNIKPYEIVNGEEVGSKHFVMRNYSNNFIIPVSDLESIRSKYSLNGSKKNGYEFFIYNQYLLLHESKINWLREII